jgi:hypothetical protein
MMLGEVFLEKKQTLRKPAHSAVVTNIWILN